MSDAIRKRATHLEAAGFDSLDAMHLACAESGGAEYFITCDDAISKRARKNPDSVPLRVCGPLEFLIEEVF